MDRNTGSSLYSRDTMIHMSIVSRRMRAGSTVSNRFWIQLLTRGACSRCVSTRSVGNTVCAKALEAETSVANRVRERRVRVMGRLVARRWNLGGALSVYIIALYQ